MAEYKRNSSWLRGVITLSFVATVSLVGSVATPSADVAHAAGPPLVSLVPARLLETRSGPTDKTVDGQFEGGGVVGAGSTTQLTVAGRGGVPADAEAVLLNVTAVLPAAEGFLTVFPCGEDRPLASNVNYGPGDVAPNAVLAKIGAGGKVCIYTFAATHLIADVNGYVSGIPFGPMAPTSDRITETAEGVLVVEDELVVAVELDHPNPDQVASAAASANGGVIIGSSPGMALYQIQFDTELAETQALIPIIEAIPGVEFASLNVVDRDQEAIPDDPRWDSWDESSPAGNNWGLEFIGAPTAWDVQTGSSSVRIGVIDADMDEDHGDLDDNVVNRDRGPAANGHGTHVAGTICAEGDNGRGITGVMWDCEMRYYSYGTDAMTTADAMRRAADDGNRVVNMSLQFIENNTNIVVTPAIIELTDATNDIFGRAVIYAQLNDHDVLWVFAAGNETQRDVEFTAPGGLAARFPTNTMSVAAIDQFGNLASFSNVGDLVSVAAPGVGIYSTLPRTGCPSCTDNFGNKNGTSMAAPHVTGLAGLVIADDPSRTAADVKACILGGAVTSGATVPGQPFPVIDAPAALDCDAVLDLPDEVDVILAFDLTGSMGGVIELAKDEMTTAINSIAVLAPGSDIRYAVVSYEDYNGFFDSTPCGSTYSNFYGDVGDEPFRINQALRANTGATQSAVDALTLGFGSDGPESYTRMLWELAQSDTAAALNLRSDSLKLIVNFGDNLPHDPNLNEGVVGTTGIFDTGIDPGRNAAIDCGGDDIDLQDDALADLSDAGVRLLHVDSAFGTFNEPYWRTWASMTGGGYTQLGSDRSLSEVIVELLAVV